MSKEQETEFHGENRNLAEAYLGWNTQCPGAQDWIASPPLALKAVSLTGPWILAHGRHWAQGNGGMPGCQGAWRSCAMKTLPSRSSGRTWDLSSSVWRLLDWRESGCFLSGYKCQSKNNKQSGQFNVQKSKNFLALTWIGIGKTVSHPCSAMSMRYDPSSLQNSC